MRLVAAALLLSGCDLVFGTTAVSPKDAGDDVDQAIDFSMPTKRLIGVAAMIVQVGGSSMPFEEYVRKPNGIWTARQNPHTSTELGVGRMRQPNLSADGKTLVFVAAPSTGGVETVMYARRGDMGLDFGAAQPIVLPFTGPQYPYLRPDCSRLYLNSDSGLIYTQPPS